LAGSRIILLMHSYSLIYFLATRNLIAPTF